MFLKHSIRPMLQCDRWGARCLAPQVLRRRPDLLTGTRQNWGFGICPQTNYHRRSWSWNLRL